jgi:hypothetical protein
MMEDLQYLATWVKEQHAHEYILTWLLSEPGLWWSQGEVYDAVSQKSGKLLKEYVQKKQQDQLFQGIADKLGSDESWDIVVGSLGRVLGVYQEELVKLQDQSRRLVGVKTGSVSNQLPVDLMPILEVQQALPDPYQDALTRSDPSSLSPKK